MNFIKTFQSQMTWCRWLTFLLRSMTVTLTVLLFWISFFWRSYLWYNGFPSIRKSWSCCLSFHWLSNKLRKRDALFHSIAYDFFCAAWGSLRDHLRDVWWENNFKCSASTAASELCEWVQDEIGAYIPHHRYQVKPHSFPWFTAACAATVAHRNHFFCL